MDQLKKWKEEFHKEFALTNCVDYSDAHGFVDHEVNLLWLGFKAAKRSQPVVELPMHDRNYHTDAAFYIQKLRKSLADAGIQYRIKGE